MATGFVGEIRMFGGSFAPKGWALCNGQVLLISQNEALFSVIGTFYGGDGMSNFCLPNLMGRAPVHWGQGAGLSNYVIGEMTGSERVGLTPSNLPAHTHPLNASTNGGNQASPSGGCLAVESTGTSMNYSNTAPNASMANTSIGQTGSNVPISIIQPITCVSFIICLLGVFPSRS